jgi:hypothetical protein
MSVMVALRRGLSLLAVPALAGLVISGYAGTLLPSAGAAASSPARIALHSAGKVRLGSSSGLFTDVFTEAPNGTLYYSVGSVVREVRGTSAPRVVLHAGHKVIALAASSSRLFVQTQLRVTEYSRSSGRRLRHWTLHSPVTPITSAGLFVVGRALWSWTDWANDMSGFEFATVSRIRTSSSKVHEIHRMVYPGDMSADSAGLYFEAVKKDGSNGDLILARPSGALRQHSDSAVDAPLALSGGRVDVLTSDILTYSRTTLARRSVRSVSPDDRNIAATTAGLLVLKEPCAGISCASATVSVLHASTGTVSGTTHIAHAAILLPGPKAAVITTTGGHLFLVRLGS